MLVTSTISLTTFITNQAVYGQTLKKTSMSVLRPLTIQYGDIKAEIDNPATLPQVYTFGSSIQNRWVATGGDTNYSIIYSDNGYQWTGVTSPNNPFTTGTGVAWNGVLWVAVGNGSNTIATSSNGSQWSGLGNIIFTYGGSGVAWGGNQWVAVGLGSTYGIATSPNGINWTPQGAGISNNMRSVAYNGSMWVAVGNGGNKIAYSSNGSSWMAVTDSSGNMFSNGGNGIAWNGIIWVAVGGGDYAIATSINGSTWTARDQPYIANAYCVAWNGSLWVVGSESTNKIITSLDGITWTPASIVPDITVILGVTWNGTMWIAVGYGSNTSIYSYDGTIWFAGGFYFNTSFVGGSSIAFNNRRPYTLSFPTNVSTATIGSISPYTFPISIAQSSQLDVVSDAYYNTGYTNFSMTVRGQYS
jgi:hypothetical protein